MAKPMLDCQGCNMKRAMAATKVPKFGGIVRFIGFVIVVPSVLGCGLAILMLIASTTATVDVMQQVSSEAEMAGAAIGSTISYGFSIFVGISSLVSGLIGWLLIMKRKVFKCQNCGYIMDRA